MRVSGEATGLGGTAGMADKSSSASLCDVASIFMTAQPAFASDIKKFNPVQFLLTISMNIIALFHLCHFFIH